MFLTVYDLSSRKGSWCFPCDLCLDSYYSHSIGICAIKSIHVAYKEKEFSKMQLSFNKFSDGQNNENSTEEGSSHACSGSWSLFLEGLATILPGPGFGV